jgi:hypothetical protein
VQISGENVKNGDEKKTIHHDKVDTTNLDKALALGHWPRPVALVTSTRASERTPTLGWHVPHLSTGSDCKLCDKNVSSFKIGQAMSRHAMMRHRDVAVLIKWQV